MGQPWAGATEKAPPALASVGGCLAGAAIPPVFHPTAAQESPLDRVTLLCHTASLFNHAWRVRWRELHISQSFPKSTGCWS